MHFYERADRTIFQKIAEFGFIINKCNKLSVTSEIWVQSLVSKEFYEIPDCFGTVWKC